MKEFDFDKNGTLDFSEATVMISDMFESSLLDKYSNSNMSQKDIKAEFEAMDLDGNKKIDLREIKGFCKELCRRKISELEL